MTDRPSRTRPWAAGLLSKAEIDEREAPSGALSQPLGWEGESGPPAAGWEEIPGVCVLGICGETGSPLKY